MQIKTVIMSQGPRYNEVPLYYIIDQNEIYIVEVIRRESKKKSVGLLLY